MEGPADTTSGEVVDRWLHAGDGGVADRVAIATRRAGGWATSTYGALDHRSRSVAGRLAGLGVRPGDRVALLGEAGGDWTAAFLGTLRCGAIEVTLDVKLTAEELTVCAGVPACRRPSCRPRCSAVGPTVRR